MGFWMARGGAWPLMAKEGARESKLRFAAFSEISSKGKTANFDSSFKLSAPWTSCPSPSTNCAKLAEIAWNYPKLEEITKNSLKLKFSIFANFH